MLLYEKFIGKLCSHLKFINGGKKAYVVLETTTKNKWKDKYWEQQMSHRINKKICSVGSQNFQVLPPQTMSHRIKHFLGYPGHPETVK